MARSPSLPDLHPELTRSWLNRARSTDSYTKVNPHLPSLPSPRLPPVVTDHTNSAMIFFVVCRRRHLRSPVCRSVTSGMYSFFNSHVLIQRPMKA